jgi:MoxR-like ATPase
MNQPWGRGKQKIDSTLMLKESIPVIGTGEWNDFQCRNFKGSDSKGLKEGDIILVREGADPIALCKIASDHFSDQDLEKRFHHNWYRRVEILSWYNAKKLFPQPQSTLQRLNNSNTDSWKFINDFYRKIIQKESMNKIKNLLGYKKQIILQGPPGTGKTRLAKKIAKDMISSNKINFDDDLVRLSLKEGLIIQSASGKTSYEIIKLEDTKCSIKGIDSKEYSVSYQSIIAAIDSKIWESGNQKNGLDPYKAAIGKYLFDNMNNFDYLVNQNLKLIQFHPSFTYEDFVRGITAKNNGINIEYKTENKIIASFAKEALKNYEDSRKDSNLISAEQNIEKNFDDFIDHVQDEIDKNGKYLISKLGYINEVDSDAFRYKGDNWASTFRMPFNEIIKLHKLNVLERKSIKKQATVLGRAKQHATYYFNLLEKFRAFIPEITLVDDTISINENKYVLIIDEINRANLAAVLGELIYALEYRGKTVQSMYDIEGENDLILPPNLFIIGTMNTADRSVGHIDYAIRRRFAFVDVLPKDLSGEEKTIFDSKLFNLVKDLFTTDDYTTRSSYLSTDFEPKDVALGHSYFIDKTKEGGSMSIRWKYEIKPILLEYIKDGILKETARAKISELDESLMNA